MTATATIDAAELALLKEKASHLDRAYAIWQAAHYSDGPDRALNITRFHDLLGMESGADKWPDSVFLGDEIAD